MYLFCDSWIHVITFYLGHVCVVLCANALVLAHLVCILVRTNQNKLEVNSNRKTVTRNVIQFQLVVTSLFEIEILSFTHRYKGYKILYDFGSQSFPGILSEVGLNSKLGQTVWSIQNWHLIQISVTITPTSLVR
jgi:hypothetical protein